MNDNPFYEKLIHLEILRNYLTYGCHVHYVVKDQTLLFPLIICTRTT